VLGTIIISVILAALISLAVWSIIKAKKSGCHSSCGGDCSNCVQNYNCEIKKDD